MRKFTEYGIKVSPLWKPRRLYSAMTLSMEIISRDCTFSTDPILWPELFSVGHHPGDWGAGSENLGLALLTEKEPMCCSHTNSLPVIATEVGINVNDGL